MAARDRERIGIHGLWARSGWFRSLRALPIAAMAIGVLVPPEGWSQAFTPAELDRRDAAIAGERARVEAVIAQAGGFSGWMARLDAFHAEMKERLARADAADQRYLEGPGGSLFTTELTRYAMADALGGAPGGPVMESSAYQAIVGLAEQLAARRIHLIFIPIPQKEELYPRSLSPEAPSDVPLYPQRYRYLRALLDAGVEAVDLLPVLRAEKERTERPLYPATDLHWSNRALGAAAAAIAARLERYAFVRGHGEPGYTAEPYRLEAQGPLVKYFVAEASWGRYPPLVEEGLRILLPDGRNYEYNTVPDGPILMIGDSFMMRARPGGSWAARLAYESGVPVTGHMENQKGAQSAARILARKGPAFYQDRRVIIWYTVGGMLSRAWSEAPLPE